jgi:hypothetical protein
MKHINKKIRLAGAGSTLRFRGNPPGVSNRQQGRFPNRDGGSSSGGGGGDKKKVNTKHNSKGPEIIPPIYLPPQLGSQQYGASHSYAETIDLLTDGPIAGIVNQNGFICDGGNIMQGIYLDDTPIAVTDNSTIAGYFDLGSASDPTGALQFNDNKLISGFFEELKGVGNLGGANGWNPTAPQSLVTMGVKWGGPRPIRIRNNIGSYELFTHTSNGSWPVRRTGGHFNANYNQYQTVCLYTDNATVEDSKFMFSVGNLARNVHLWGMRGASSARQHLKYSPSALTPSEQYGNPKCGLQANLDLIYNNFYSQTENKHQRELARRVLGRLGDGYPEQPLGQRLKDVLNASSSRNCHVVLRPDKTQAGIAGMNLLNGGKLMDYSFKLFNSEGTSVFSGMDDVFIYDFICPEINTDGTLTGQVEGFIIISFRWLEGTMKGGNFGKKTANWARAYGVSDKITDAFRTTSSLHYSRDLPTAKGINTLKFNYSNVLAEYRAGTEDQVPLKYFNHVFIDHVYDTPLYGPFKPGRPAQSVATNRNMLTSPRSRIATANGLPVNEGSEDTRGRGRHRYDYANWAKDSLPDFEEAAITQTHIVLNPNVDSVFVTLNVGALRDTLQTQMRGVRGAQGSDGTLNPGAVFPSILNVSVTTGMIDENGTKTPHKTRNYRIMAVIESNTLIDIGNPDGIPETYTYVEPLGDAENLVTPIPLPALNQENIKAHRDANLNTSVVIKPDEHISTQRYVEVARLSTETNSVLITKSVDLSKVTEIIPVNLTYPFSTLVGTKLDSRSFGSIPIRSFDCKLKKVKIPSNYKPMAPNGQDKRYFLTQGEFDDALKENKLIYDGDWDGTFDEELQWTDNPAWILYDLLTSTRYGLGQHVDEDTINKWQLYEIGRFCDAVDDNGYFLGVPDGHGGREPRFSCNIVFDAGLKIYDAINTIVGLFRGSVFYNNGEINFVDDRPRETVTLFTNESVAEGMFHYANNRRDQTYNCIEVTYTDRFDSYIPKVEVVEDEDDIRKRGYFKKRMEAIGITSRAMARRAAQHQIFSTTKENQTVAFEAGLESLLCQPGDLIVVEDELKTLKENFGKILEVNVADETIRLSNTFNSSDMTGSLTVYTPTGRDTITETEDVAKTNRQRSIGFTITGDVLPTASKPFFSGEYNFSGYIPGYSYATGQYDPTPPQASGAFEEYALYTGTGFDIGGVKHMNMLYFSTGFTGWIFATGTGDINVDSDSQSIFIASGTGSTLYDLGTGEMCNYDTNETDRRGESYGASVSGMFSGNNILSSITKGLLPSEVMLTSPAQTTVLSVTGEITLKDYGCLVSGFTPEQAEMLAFLKLGSTAKFEIKEKDPYIYKVLAISEVNPNQFLISATKYDTGKWTFIEDNISIENKANTFAYRVAQCIGDICYTTLEPPRWTGLATGNGAEFQSFFISGDFTDPNGGPPIGDSNATGFEVTLQGPRYREEQVISTASSPSALDSFCVKFDNLNSIGQYRLDVRALGNQGSTNTSDAYFNSSPASTGMFVLFEENLMFGRSWAEKVTIQ